MPEEVAYVFLIIGALLLLYLLIKFSKWKKRFKAKRHIRTLTRHALEMTPDQFLAIRQEQLKQCRKNPNLSIKQLAGIYILYNKTKNLYYVGQGKQLFSRVNSHFTGKGNGDVYADYKYGDVFTIKMIPLEGSGAKTLNELERKTIQHYNAFARGYNKTRGNKG